MSTNLKDRIKQAMKEAMRARAKPRLGAIRLIQAEIKRIEVDERIDVEDDRLLVILDKMTKQRRDSIKQYELAKREDLAEVERFEITVIQEFLPQQLTADELEQIVSKAIADSGAEGIRDMGKVMGLVKPQIQGRADVGAVSQQIKLKLG